MTFLSLNDTAKSYIIALVMLAAIILLITVIANIVEKSKKSHIILYLCLFFICVFNYALLVELNKYERLIYNSSLTSISVFVNSLPIYTYIIMNIFFILICVYSMFNIYKNGKNKINIFSVKEALENLPTGIAFMTNDIKLLLSNHIIHDLCKELTGKTLYDAQEFWRNITNLQNNENCVIKGEKPAYVLNDGRVFQFSKKLCIYDDEDFYEITATNITQLYELSENTRAVNEKLQQQQQRLKELTNMIEENVENGVALNMKINFHDNFGNLLTLTKKTLRESENIDEARTLVDYWQNLNSVIKELSSDDKHSLSLQQILIFAKKLGCEIIINGDIPEDEHNKTTTLLCINEMLKNAYRHANAQTLTVNITQEQGTIALNIQNETEHNLPEIKEGGGLFGLRQRVELAGGKMSMSCDNGVRMSVKMPIGGKQYV